MRKIRFNLSKQLICITLISLLLIISLISFVLPLTLKPYFENTVYSYLDRPLEMIGKEKQTSELENIIYIQRMYNGEYNISPNYKEIIDIEKTEIENIINLIDTMHGKFKYNGKTYYYSTKGKDKNNIAITDEYYINELKNNLLIIIIPSVTIIFIITLILLLIWSNNLVRKIGKIKEKIDNFNNPDYNGKSLKLNDELMVLDETIDKTKYLILSKEQYEREMYQNISHDFKTPIMVVKSYIEAYHDNIESADNVINITNDEMNKLETKVKTMLELNKATYLKNKYKNDEKIDIIPLLEDKIKKYKIINKKLEYNLEINDKEKVNGNLEIWESIINNLLSNAIRYASSEVKVTINKNHIIFYNDGEKIKDNMINKIFDTYVKGNKGEHGLGLSIVKKNVQLINYNIYVKNKDVGVEFIIEK